MPTGCNQALSETTTPTQWFVDPSSSSSATCTTRLRDFNNYCGKNDAVSQWTSNQPQAGETPGPNFRNDARTATPTADPTPNPTPSATREPTAEPTRDPTAAATPASTDSPSCR